MVSDVIGRKTRMYLLVSDVIGSQTRLQPVVSDVIVSQTEPNQDRAYGKIRHSEPY